MDENEISQIDIPYEELKSLVFAAIRNHGDSFKFNDVCHTTAGLAVSKRMVKNPALPNRQVNYYSLNKTDVGKVREVIWDLITQRVLTIGDYYQDSWPCLSLTDYGKKAMKSTEPIPNDATGYLDRIKKEVPDLDKIIETYLIESIRTYNINQLLSATITLGCASEKALLILVDTFEKTYKNKSKAENFSKKIKDRFIKTQFDEFDKAFYQTLPHLDYYLKENYDNTLKGIFSMIRENRNNAGHPTGQQVSKETLFANLQVFIPYCKYIYTLKNYLNKNLHD